MKTAAFFDLDGTILKGVSAFRFSRFLFRRKILPINFGALKHALKAAYDYFKGRSYECIDDSDDLLGAAFKGLSKKVVTEQARQYAGLELSRVYKKSLNLINYHKSKKHMLFLLSVSPQELVKPLGDLLGFDESFGTRLAVKKGVYTGAVKTPSMINKERAVIVKRLAKRYNINLEDSFAYGDSVNDSAVLTLVGNPRAVNPDSSMRRLAAKNKWRIV